MCKTFVKQEGCSVNNVSQPTLTLYSQKGTNTGVAIVVFHRNDQTLRPLQAEESVRTGDGQSHEGMVGFLDGECLSDQVEGGPVVADAKFGLEGVPRDGQGGGEMEVPVRHGRSQQRRWRMDGQ